MTVLGLPSPARYSTPPTYHRIISSELHLPDDTSQAIPVGLLACQRDPLLRELRTSVISCRVHQPTVENSSKSGNRKSKPISTAISATLLEVVLHDTVLFPEGGGQPTDTGVLRLTSGPVLNVVDVKRHGGIAVHYVLVDGQTICGLEVGAHLTVALDEVGFQRRLDHMCMHTSQHLLSAILETQLSLPTLSWALTTYPTPSYVELPRALTNEELTRVQATAHAYAYEGRAVHIEVEPLSVHGPNANHPGVAIHESGRTVGKALPQDYTGGVKRVVVIDGVDRNPCCGTHLPSLHNLHIFLLPQAESLARGSTSTSRLFFLSGPRLHEHLATTHNLLTATASTLSCGPPLAPERVVQVVEERKRMTKRAEELASELARVVAKGLLREMESALASNENLRVFTKHYHRSDDPIEALPFLQSVSSSFANLLTSSQLSSQAYILVITSSAQSQTSNSTSTALMLSSDATLIRTVGDVLKARLGVKGGGKGMRWSGKRIGIWKEAQEGVIVKEILRQVSPE